MTWTLTNIDTGASIVIPTPEPGDTHRIERRQASGETEGGRLFTQDLGINDEFLEGSWSGINRCDRDALVTFFNGVKWRAKSFILDTTGGGAQVKSGAGGGWRGRVRLDQSRLDARAVTTDPARSGAGELYEFTMRFRVIPQIQVIIRDLLQVFDKVTLGGDVTFTLADGITVTDGIASVELS